MQTQPMIRSVILCLNDTKHCSKPLAVPSNKSQNKNTNST